MLAGSGRGGCLIELNPETGAIVNEYNYDDVTNYGESTVAVIDGIIYASFEKPSSYMSVTMSSVGNITRTVEYFARYKDVAISKGKLYVADGASSGTIMQVNGLSYAECVNVVTNTPSYIIGVIPDGSGGLFYALGDGSIYHWNGTSSSKFCDSETLGTYSSISGASYDSRNQILYVMCGASYYAVKNGELIATFSDAMSIAAIGNPSESTSTGNVPGGSESTSSLPSAVIEPTGTLSDEVLENLAELVNIQSSEINYITQDNVSTAQEPTQSMIQYMKDDGYEPAYKLNVVTVEETGHYVFVVNVPEEFIGKKVSDVKIYALGQNDFTDSSVKNSFFGLINGILNFGELTNLTGQKVDSLGGKMLAIGMLQAGQPFSVFFAKLLIALLTGGCNVISAFGIVALVFVPCVFYIRRRR